MHQVRHVSFTPKAHISAFVTNVGNGAQGDTAIRKEAAN